MAGFLADPAEHWKTGYSAKTLAHSWEAGDRLPDEITSLIKTIPRYESEELEKLVRDLAREDPVCWLLMTMPGVGPVVALTFMSAIDDPERFRRSKDVGP